MAVLLGQSGGTGLEHEAAGAEWEEEEEGHSMMSLVTGWELLQAHLASCWQG